jgi:hypothetical protein
LRRSYWQIYPILRWLRITATMAEFGWKYVCRTASNAILNDGNAFSFQELHLEPGMCLGIGAVLFTRQRYGPVLAVAWWRKGFEEPLYLISNMDLKQEACYWYQKRFKSKKPGLSFAQKSSF